MALITKLSSVFRIHRDLENRWAYWLKRVNEKDKKMASANRRNRVNIRDSWPTRTGLALSWRDILLTSYNKLYMVQAARRDRRSILCSCQRPRQEIVRPLYLPGETARYTRDHEACTHCIKYTRPSVVQYLPVSCVYRESRADTTLYTGLFHRSHPSSDRTNRSIEPRDFSN